MQGITEAYVPLLVLFLLSSEFNILKYYKMHYHTLIVNIQAMQNNESESSLPDVSVHIHL